MAVQNSFAKRLKLLFVFIFVGMAFYFHFKSKQQSFFSAEFLFRRMYKEQLLELDKLKNAKGEPVDSVYREIENDWKSLFSDLSKKLIKENRWSQEVTKFDFTNFTSKNGDIFKPFRRSWKGVEEVEQHFKKFEIHAYPEYKKEGDVYIYFFNMRNRAGQNFYGLNLYNQTIAPLIIGEVRDEKENLTWKRIGYPYGDKSLIWITLIKERGKSVVYKFSKQTLRGNKLYISGYEILYDRKEKKLVAATPLYGEYEALTTEK